MCTQFSAAIQLYSINNSSAPLPELIRRVGRAGYDGVEFANRFREANPKAIADALDDTDMEAVACHADLSAIKGAINGDNDLLERCETAGINHLVNPHTSMASFRSETSVRSLLAQYHEVAEELATRDMRLVHHTSRHEFWMLMPKMVETMVGVTPIPDGITSYISRELSRLRTSGIAGTRTGFQTLVAETSPTNLQFEIDIAEVTAGRFDPIESISLVENRLPMIHLRDIAPKGRLGTYEDAKGGEGAIDFEQAVDAAVEAGTEWIVYEDEVPQDPKLKLNSGISLMDELNAPSRPHSSPTGADS